MTVSGAISTIARRYGIEMEKTYFSDPCRSETATPQMFALIDAVGRSISANLNLNGHEDFTTYDYLMKALVSALEPPMSQPGPAVDPKPARKGQKGKR